MGEEYNRKCKVILGKVEDRMFRNECFSRRLRESESMEVYFASVKFKDVGN